MDCEHFFSRISLYVQLEPNEKDYLNSVLIPRPFRPGEIIVKSGEPSRYLVFADSGYLMTYYTDQHGAEHVIQFAANGWWSGDLYSLGEEQTTPFSTKGLSSGEALLLPKPALNHLLEKFPKFERYFRIMFHKGFMRQQLRFVEGFSTSAEERYLSFIKTYPTIVQEVPQSILPLTWASRRSFLVKSEGSFSGEIL